MDLKIRKCALPNNVGLGLLVEGILMQVADCVNRQNLT